MGHGANSVAVKRTKLINTSRIIREIWMEGQTSRVDIARNLALDKSTISAIVGELLDLGVIRETTEGSAGPQGGRKPVYLRLNQNFGCVVGIELRPESYTASAVDLAGNVIFSKFEHMQNAGSRLRDSVLEIVELMRPDLDRAGLPLLGVGVALSGVVNPQTGAVRYSIPLKLTESYNIYEDMEGRLGVPFFVENDANACAWGELAYHRHRNLTDFIFALVEFRDLERTAIIHEKTAVGFGIVINGKVHYGYRYSAGEFRSLYRDPDIHKGQFALTDEELSRMDDDPAVMDRFFDELSRHIALFVNTFDLGHIFIGGTNELVRHDMHRQLYDAVQANWPYPDEVPVAISYSSFRQQAAAYGAAGMVLERLFADLEVMEGVADLRDAGSSLLPGWPVLNKEQDFSVEK